MTSVSGMRDAPEATRESYSYDDSIVRMFVAATILWAIVATSAGVLVAGLMVMPGLTGGLEWFSFGRLRPLHTSVALFALMGNAVFAAVYYSTQRLCQARMWSDALGRLHFWLWQLIIVSAVITVPLGFTQGKEYAEPQWPIDLAIAVVWTLIFGGNFFMTLVNRRQLHLYISLWFYIATIVTVAIVHILNSLVMPTGVLSSDGIYAGVHDAMIQWWYGQNLLAFLLAVPFVGLMYYFLPKAVGQPVFSYRLSILHFWSFVLICVGSGPRHLHYTALPEWASTQGMLFGIMLWMPAWGGVVNGLLTLRGAWHKVVADPVLKFFVVGLIFYATSTLEASVLSFKSINALTQYTDWTIAHFHSGALGWNGFMTFGMIYWLLPRLFQTQVWSRKLVSLHFWMGTVAILLYIVPIYAAGLKQGLMCRGLDQTGNLTYPDFLETTQTILPMWWVRVCGGILYLSGVLALMVNAVMTWRNRPARYEVPVYCVPSLSPDHDDDPRPEKSSLDAAPVLATGKKIDVFARMRWHRRWERLPVKFTALVTAVVVLVTLFEMIPLLLIGSNVPAIATVQPYTPLELAGRHIYISEGCHNCHSQMVRPLVAETKRYGEYSKPGEFVYDRPFQWGSRRIGPDLAREGGRQSSYWHWNHLKNPELVSPGSVMPSFDHLLTANLKFEAIEPHVRAAATLGAPYTQQQIATSEASARWQALTIAADIVAQGGPANKQDKQVIALIAYLQRLGTDLFRTEPSDQQAAETSAMSVDKNVPPSALAKRLPGLTR